MSEPSRRRRFSPEQKAAILRRHLADKVPVSDLCDEYQIQPSMFYTWQRQVLENLGAALVTNRSQVHEGRAQQTRLEQRVEWLEAKVAKKDRVIAEISEEYVQLKKECGEL